VSEIHLQLHLRKEITVELVREEVLNPIGLAVVVVDQGALDITQQFHGPRQLLAPEIVRHREL
jgi:hypothetical protein